MSASAGAAVQNLPSSEDPSSSQHLFPIGRVVTLEEHFLVPSLVAGKSAIKQGFSWMPPKLRNDLADLGAGRLADMDKNGITYQVLSATAPGSEVLDGEEGVRYARATNDRLAQAVREHPNRFGGFANLPMRTPEAAADELERAVTQLGFRGGLIFGMTEGRFLDDARYAVVLSRAEKLDVPIYIHPNFPPQAVMDAYFSGLPEREARLLSLGGFGWHAEMGIHIFRLALAGTFERHPGLKVIIGHMGECLPFMLDRMDHCAVDMSGYQTPVSKIIRERVYITTAGVFSTPALLCALATFGADRIMFSVDYPYSGATLGRNWVDHIPVSPADRVKIMHGNADRLLKLAT